MRDGDADLKDTIQDYLQVWKRYALEGLSSSFLILLIAPSVVTCAPGPELKELCRRLMELYMELPRIEDDSYRRSARVPLSPRRERRFLEDYQVLDLTERVLRSR